MGRKTKAPHNKTIFARVTPALLVRVDRVLEEMQANDPMANRSDAVRVLLCEALDRRERGHRS